MTVFRHLRSLLSHTCYMEYLTIGEAVRELRQRHCMTQEDLIELADLSRSQLYYIESGKRTPSLPTIYAICAALGVTFFDLVSYMYSKPQEGSGTPSISSMGAPGATIG